MGCDIHLYAEIKQRYPNPNYVAPWETVGAIFPYPYVHDEPRVPTISWSDGELSETNVAVTVHPYMRRNYDLFAILAGVRNGSGFAGVDTGDGFTPIAEPRGVPDDASSYYRREVNRYDGDGHSHSWVSLAELTAFDWSGQYAVHRGFVTPESFRVLEETGKPDDWCGDVWGSSTSKVSNERMREIVVSPPDDGLTYYTQIEWTESYAASCESFLNEAMPRLQELAELPATIDLRLVFFFDN